MLAGTYLGATALGQVLAGAAVITPPATTPARATVTAEGTLRATLTAQPSTRAQVQ